MPSIKDNFIHNGTIHHINNYLNIANIFLFFSSIVLTIFFIIHLKSAHKCEHQPYHHMCSTYTCPDGSKPTNCTHTL